MEYFAGLDVSVKDTSVCIVDETGKIVREVKVAGRKRGRGPYKKVGLYVAIRCGGGPIGVLMIEDLIYDVGMNDGADTAYYLRKGFRVVAIEADPRLAEKAAGQFDEEIRANRLHILNIGIAAEEGELPFWICDEHPEWSSFYREHASRDGCQHHQIIVRCKRFASVLQDFGVPYHLKIDIEGNDCLCVQDLDPQQLPKFMSMEAPDPSEFMMLKELGFKRFKCISQYNFLPIEVPPAREQRRYERFLSMLQTRNPLVRAFRVFGGRRWLERQVNSGRREANWTFLLGSSGPFGDDLPGRWLSYDELVTTYEQTLNLRCKGKSSPFWNDKEYSFWFDVHARSD
jgi:FkbM family methyltransferase